MKGWVIILVFIAGIYDLEAQASTYYLPDDLSDKDLAGVSLYDHLEIINDPQRRQSY